MDCTSVLSGHTEPSLTPGRAGGSWIIPANLRLRSRQPDDLEALFRLLSQADFQRNASTLDPLLSSAEMAGYLALQGPGVFEIVALIEDLVVGFAGLYAFGGKQRHTGSCTLAVHEQFQRHGIGTALVRALLATATYIAALERVQLTVFVDNARAISLYQRSGFQVEGLLHRFAKREDGFVDAHLMAWHRPFAAAS